jgi:hypothetical protein
MRGEIMTSQRPITIILANRPRLFRELLHHALATASPKVEVVEANDLAAASMSLKRATWLVVDEEAATDMHAIMLAYPDLAILTLDSRGSRARVLAPSLPTHSKESEQNIGDVPTLTQLVELLTNRANSLTTVAVHS